MTRHARPRALQILAGPLAMRHVRSRGLSPDDIRVVPAAAGGPKGLILNPLDRFIFGHWLRDTQQVVHLVGASIGAWRMACACQPDADAALAELAQDYIHQRYVHAPGKAPEARHVSEVLGRLLDQRLGERSASVLAHPTRRLHVVTSRGRHLLARQGRVRTPLGYLGAFISNAVRRRALGYWLERVVFSDQRDALPMDLGDLHTRCVALSQANLARSVLASCSIPFWLDAVQDIPGAPLGAYCDGGITDYHLHWNYGSMRSGLVLYPHFQSTVVPGWLDKAFARRHLATPFLDNVVVLAPTAQWLATLPNGKLPDRSDFTTYAEDFQSRVNAWRAAVAASEQLAEEFAAWVCDGVHPDIQALA